jgi:hypothetical protein
VGMVPSGGRSGYFAVTTGARVLREAAEANYEETVAWLASHPGRLSREDLMGLAEAVSMRLNADPVDFLAKHSNDGSLRAILPAIDSALLNRASGKRSEVWKWLKAQPATDEIKSLRESVLNGAAWQESDVALKLANDLPKTPEGDHELQSLARSLLNGGSRLHRFEEYYRLAPERLRPVLLEQGFGALNDYSFHDPQPWIDRLPQLPEASRGQAVASLVGAWASKRPEEAAAWVATLPDEEMRNNSFINVASTWALKDQRSAAEWVRSLPDGMQRDLSAEGLVYRIAESQPEEAWQWTLSIADKLHRTRAAYHTVQLMAKRDRSTAQRWIENSPFDTKEKARMQEVILPLELRGKGGSK